MSAHPRIQATDRVADVLARDEALVDVFVRHSPHFAKLRSGALRRVMARLVTVEQAARIAAVDVDALLRDLDAALGLEPRAEHVADDGARARDDRAAIATHPAGAPVVELDVRDDLREGREPFSRIMAAVAALADRDVLRLRATFEPAPLIAVLARRGFAHESLEHAADDWSVWFWRDASASREEGRPARDASSVVELARDEQMLDVRGLEPPEPMLRTMRALESMPRGCTLVHVNVRVPRLLLPMLVESGFAFDIDESDPERVVVRIRHAE
jgi:hypothetical protein